MALSELEEANLRTQLQIMKEVNLSNEHIIFKISAFASDIFKLIETREENLEADTMTFSRKNYIDIHSKVDILRNDQKIGLIDPSVQRSMDSNEYRFKILEMLQNKSTQK